MLGPLAGLVLNLFITERIVPGPAYRRVVNENKRLAAENSRLTRRIEEVIPLAKGAVEAARINAVAFTDLVKTLESVQQLLTEAKAASDEE